MPLPAGLVVVPVSSRSRPRLVIGVGRLSFPGGCADVGWLRLYKGTSFPSTLNEKQFGLPSSQNAGARVTEYVFKRQTKTPTLGML